MQTYQAIYRSPVNHIAVPEQFRMGNFEVSFKEIPAENNTKQIKNMPNPLLRGSVTIIDDVTPLDNDWELD